MPDSRMQLCIIKSILLVLFIQTGLAACKGKPPEKPLPSVTTVNPIEKEVTEWDEYSGRLESPQIANVAARVTGNIIEAPFKEGSFVQQNDLLYVIDDRSFKAELASTEADVAKVQAIFSKASSRLHRFENVRSSGAVSAEDYDQAKADLKQAEAELASARAAMTLAQLNLEWTRVRAPISGLVSRKLVTEGNNVIGGSGQMTQLTTITSLDPLYSYISVPEANYHKYQKSLPSTATSEESPLPCEFLVENSTTYRKDCFIDFIDSQVNIATGTVQLRGVISNPDRSLKTGMFVRMRLPGTAAYKATLVPDIAVGADQSSRFLLVVNNEGVVESRPVKLGAQFSSLRAITEGIKLEDRVIVSGLQSARAGTKVNASEQNSISGSPAIIAEAKK